MRDITVTIASNAFSCEGLEVLALVGRERLSCPYEFDVDLVARGDEAPSVEAIAGSGVRLFFTMDGEPERVVHGIVARAVDDLDPSSGLRTYHWRVVPELVELSQVMLQGVFRGTVPQVISEKLAACEVRHELRLSGSYPERDYIGQFAETDLAFVGRLAEHLGIAYFFADDDEGERVVFTDDSRFLDARRELAIPFRPRGEVRDVHRFATEANLAPSLAMVADYNYRTPQTTLVGRFELANGTGGGIIEYGSHVRTVEEAETLARLRGEEAECRRLVHRGESDRAVLRAGLMFTLTDHPHLGDRELLVVEVEHRIEQPARATSNGALAYANRFVAIPAATPFRPERVTPVPRIAGFRTGTVLPLPGGNDQVPWLDEAGRYRVGLLFDTLSPSFDDATARPMRMVQAHAGPGYGIHFPLRPGTEVVVGFVNGDIDRPMIVGAVPNPLTASPVVDKQPLHHRIRTASGVTLEFEDGT